MGSRARRPELHRGPGGATFWRTPAGINALFTLVLKATKPIALAQRRNTYEWSVPSEDIVASGFSTAWRARIEADGVDLPGGWAEGKVVSLTIKDTPAAGGYPEATIRIASCDGTGEAGEPGDLTVVYTGEPWDRVAIAAFAGYPPTHGPVPGGEAYLENGVADQLAYGQANDYRGNVPGRDDASANDPKQVLRKVPTKITLAMNQIGGQGAHPGLHPARGLGLERPPPVQPAEPRRMSDLDAAFATLVRNVLKGSERDGGRAPLVPDLKEGTAPPIVSTGDGASSSRLESGSSSSAVELGARGPAMRGEPND